ncbi:MAG: hypothetical protein RLN75_04985, partial [Longimicrobiales bacterium]
DTPTDSDPAAALRIVPVFRQSQDELPILPVDEIRVRVFDLSGEVLLAESSTPVGPSDIEVEVELQVDVTPGQAVTVDVALRGGGADVYVGGPVAVVPAEVPVEIEVDYVGAGACEGVTGSIDVGPVGGSPSVATGRLELGDCYEPEEFSFADRWGVDLSRDAGVDLFVEPTGGSADLHLRLLTPDGSVVADHDTDGFALFVAAGSYVVEVTSVAPLATVPYRLSLIEFDRCDSETGQLAPAVSASQALTTIDCPLASGRSADLWGVEVGADTPYRIDLESDAFDAQLLLTYDDVLDPFLGAALDQDDDHGLDTDALLAGVLPAGRYRVWATSFSSGEVGPYQISMHRLSTGAPTLEVRAVDALGPGGPDGTCGSAQAYVFRFGFEDGDGDLVQGGGVTIRLTGIPSGLQETKGLGWEHFPDLNPYAGYAEILTCESFATSDTGKLAEFFITDAAGRSSAIYSTTLTPVSSGRGAPTSGAPVATPAGAPTVRR